MMGQIVAQGIVSSACQVNKGRSPPSLGDLIGRAMGLKEELCARWLLIFARAPFLAHDMP